MFDAVDDLRQVIATDRRGSLAMATIAARIRVGVYSRHVAIRDLR